MYAVIDSDGKCHKTYPGDDSFAYRDACQYARKASTDNKGKEFHVVKTKQVVYTEKTEQQELEEAKSRIITGSVWD